MTMYNNDLPSFLLKKKKACQKIAELEDEIEVIFLSLFFYHQLTQPFLLKHCTVTTKKEQKTHMLINSFNIW